MKWVNILLIICHLNGNKTTRKMFCRVFTSVGMYFTRLFSWKTCQSNAATADITNVWEGMDFLSDSPGGGHTALGIRCRSRWEILMFWGTHGGDRHWRVWRVRGIEQATVSARPLRTWRACQTQQERRADTSFWGVSLPWRQIWLQTTLKFLAAYRP